ncbi:DsbA family protein [Patescibacteria group bacterium]
MKNVIIGVVVSTLLFIGLGWLMVGRTPELKTVEFTFSENENIAGNASASATLVEFSDFECPACASYSYMVNQLKQDLGDKVRIIYRHFPLRSIHDNAQLAGQAAQAAGNQEMFWQMHDKLFENQISWSELDNPEETFIGYAEELELDIEKFKTDLHSQEVEDKVNSDYQSGIQAGVNSTPSFYLNGLKLQNPGSYETFKQLIEQNLE